MKEYNPTTGKIEIIDIHCHTAGIGAGQSGCHVSPALRNSWKFDIYLKAFGVTRKEISENGDMLIIRRLSEKLESSSYVDSAIILALDCVVGDDGTPDLSHTEIYVPDEFVSSEVQKYNNLYFGSSINPYRKDAIERLEKAAEKNALLVKWLPSIQLIDPSNKKLIPFYKRLQNLGFPLLTHTGNEYAFTKARNELTDPELLRLPLDLGVTVIAAHAATNGKNFGQDNLRRILSMFSEYPNLYADISSLTQVNKFGHLQKLLRHKDIHEKLMYGTDMPILNTLAVSPLYFICSLGIKEAFSMQKSGNPWDMDVLLKKALGVSTQIFEKAGLFFADRIKALRTNRCNHKNVDMKNNLITSGKL